MTLETKDDTWSDFLSFMENRCSRAEFENWIAPIKYVGNSDPITLQVPNVFVQEYLLDNYKEALTSFFPKDKKGEPLISFLIKEGEKKKALKNKELQEIQTNNMTESKQKQTELDVVSDVDSSTAKLRAYDSCCKKKAPLPGARVSPSFCKNNKPKSSSARSGTAR